jgi:hypothetical protein
MNWVGLGLVLEKLVACGFMWLEFLNHFNVE